MSDPVLAEKDPAVVLSEALAIFKQVYEAATGKDGTLQPPDPRRALLQAFVLLSSQNRALIDFAGKQSLLRFVSDLFIDFLAELVGGKRLPALPSTISIAFVFPSVASWTVPAGVRVTDDGTNVWEVLTTTSATAHAVHALATCIVAGSASNGVDGAQIHTIVNPSLIPDCLSATGDEGVPSAGGRDLEGLEDFRTRLRDLPEARSTCGPRNAYRAAALAASSTVADAAILGPEDGAFVAAYAPGPGEVFILLLEGERDEDGVLTSVIPDPSPGVITTVEETVTAEDERPLTDFVTVQAPLWRDFDAIASYYIPESRSESAVEIQAAAAEAFDAWLLWQQSKIGRDINPSELIARLVNAGAKRVVVTEPAFSELMRDESARCTYQALVYLGVEDD